MKGTIGAVAVALVLATAAKAEVVDRSPAGFESRQEVAISARPAAVYAALFQIGRWWDSKHSWSGDARNLVMDPADGCFCEKLKKGQVRHMTIVYADGATLRLFGGLGPLQTTGATGHLSFAVQPAGPATRLVVTYDVGGYAKGGLAEVWADPVDGVIRAQVVRLKRYVETGAP